MKQVQKLNNAKNATHYVKLGKKRRENSKRNYYIICPRVIIKAIIIIFLALYFFWEVKTAFSVAPTAGSDG